METVNLSEHQLVRAGIPRRYWQVTLNLIPESSYKQDIQTYLKKMPEFLKKGIGMMFFGPNESGKTSAAVIIAKQALVHNVKVFMLTSAELKEWTVTNRLVDVENDVTVMDRCRSVDLLVVDDVGKEHVSEFSEGLIDNLIRSRYQSMKSTILTTNLSKEEVAKVLTTSTRSMIRGSMRIVCIEGRKFREDEQQEVNHSFDEGDSK